MLRPILRTFTRRQSTAARAASASAPASKSSSAPNSGVAPSSAGTPKGKADSTISSSSSASDKRSTPKVRSPTDPAADYKRRLEERFGGAEASALGTLVDGKAEGLAPHVKRNMFRVI